MIEERQVPLMVRGTIQGIPMATPRRASKSNRRMDIPLNLPGAEIRLPALPAVAFSWRIVSGILSVIMVIFLYMLWTSPVFRISEITVSGLNRITPKDIKLELNLEDHSIFTVDPQEITAKITKLFPEF
ncbi:MAG: cell division protein FtsQ/DivIB, partial [Anaerolineales bacterium]